MSELTKFENEFDGMSEDMVKHIKDNQLISKFCGLAFNYNQCNAYDDPIE